MDKAQARQFLEAISADPSKVAIEKGWHQFHCPLAPFTHGKGTDSTPSMGLKVEAGKKSIFHCFSCNFGGDAYDLLLTLQGYCKGNHDMDMKTAVAIADKELEGAVLPIVDYDDYKKEEEFFEFPEWYLESFPSVETSPEALAYLKGRGVPKEVRSFLDLRWDGVQRRVCFPIRDFESKLGGMHGRLIDPGEPRYKIYKFMQQSNMHLWHGEEHIDWDKPVLVVESVFDRARALQLYRNTISPMSASMNAQKLARVAAAFAFVHLFDGDKAGQDASYKLRKAHPHAKHQIIQLKEGTDPGSTDLFELEDVLKKVLPLDEVWLD